MLIYFCKFVRLFIRLITGGRLYDAFEAEGYVYILAKLSGLYVGLYPVSEWIEW